jgi:hypothetical protein
MIPLKKALFLLISACCQSENHPMNLPGGFKQSIGLAMIMKNSRTKLLMLFALLLLWGCSSSPMDQSESDDSNKLGDAPPAAPQFAFETHVVAKADDLGDIDQDLLINIDTIIMGAQNFPHVQDRFLDRAVLYFNMWGKCRYLDIGDWAKWQPAPGEIGEPDVEMNGGVHCYRFDDAHVVRFLGWIEAYLQDHGDRVKGIFLDDFSYSRNWWSGTDEDRDLIWGPMDGRPGWNDIPAWNEERVMMIEAGALALVRQYIGPRGVLITNGTGRSLPQVRRFAEDVGAPNSEAWDRLEQEGVDQRRYARSGDLLQVNAVGASGIWGDWSTTGAGYGWDNLVKAGILAAERNLSIGLAYGETPVQGGTIYQLYWDPAEAGYEWPGFLPPTE